MTFIVLLVARLDSVDQVAAKNCGKEFKSKSHSHFGREAILKITVCDPFIIDERKWTQRKLANLVQRLIYKVAKRTQFYLAMSSIFHNLIW